MNDACEREGCGAARCETWPWKGKRLCFFCWRAAACDSIRIVGQGGSVRAAELFFDFAASCINHGLEPPRVA